MSTSLSYEPSQEDRSSERPIALITGAARRIGASIAEDLHAHGYDILLHYRSSVDAANQLYDQFNGKRSDSCRIIAADLADRTSWHEITLAAQNWRQRLDLLVNNASAFYPTPLVDASPEQWDDLFASNAQAPYFLIQHLLPLLRHSEGCVINIIDAMVFHPAPDFHLYAMAKAALQGMTGSLARELAPEVRINGVAPGAILWPEQQADDAGARESLLAKIPMQRMGTPDDISRTVRFLASEAPYITGQIIAVDGGRSL